MGPCLPPPSRQVSGWMISEVTLVQMLLKSRAHLKEAGEGRTAFAGLGETGHSLSRVT